MTHRSLFFHAECAEFAETIRNRNAIMEEHAKAHAILAPPSGWQAQTTCVRFREFRAFCVRHFWRMGQIAWYFDYSVFQWVKLRGEFFVYIFCKVSQSLYLYVAI
jgi:hypothetical protein